MASQSESLGSQDSSRSEDETPTTSDEEFIVSDSEMEEAEQEELEEEDDIELLYESFINLREENKLIKQELAKQNNLLWEIYEELKEIKSK